MVLLLSWLCHCQMSGAANEYTLCHFTSSLQSGGRQKFIRKAQNVVTTDLSLYGVSSVQLNLSCSRTKNSSIENCVFSGNDSIWFLCAAAPVDHEFHLTTPEHWSVHSNWAAHILSGDTSAFGCLQRKYRYFWHLCAIWLLPWKWSPAQIQPFRSTHCRVAFRYEIHSHSRSAGK